jgi:hypothetical protein
MLTNQDIALLLHGSLGVHKAGVYKSVSVSVLYRLINWHVCWYSILFVEWLLLRERW